jgi:UDP-N-acetylmuramoylalanine--D-glutamate ligase
MNYCIIGAARSGIAAMRLAFKLNDFVGGEIAEADEIVAEKSSSIFIIDEKDENSFREETISELKNLNIKYHFGEISQEEIKDILKKIDCLIISPGVPPTSPFVQKAQKMKIPVISELEFAFQNLKNPIIAITGTNGKTTTTTLLTFILNKFVPNDLEENVEDESKINAVSAGNIGTPLSEIALKILDNNDETLDENTIIVTEVSSFQLEFIDTFRPKVAIILNITPDHLKYHQTFENYTNTKLKIAKNQTFDDYLILNADDKIIDSKNITEFIKKTNIKSQIYHFSASPVERGIYLAAGKMMDKMQQKEEEIMQIEKIRIPGIHNCYNSMAAGIAAKVWQVTNENIRDSLMEFQGVGHRLEFVKNLYGVDYINDSKATNVNASWYALSSYNKPIIWIAGGRGDNNDYSLLDDVIKKKVKKIITFGEEKDAIYDRYCEIVDCVKKETLNDAVRLAYRTAKNGDLVLFAPACKSFDQFLNFEHRGDVFKQIVNTLKINWN